MNPCNASGLAIQLGRCSIGRPDCSCAGAIEGDAAALAELFDRTAPELLRLALHLWRHAVDAEDVLQATFLAAIESAPRFERTSACCRG